MRSQNRRLNSEGPALRAAFELISFERPFASPVERGNMLEYVETISLELSDLLVKADVPFVAYILHLAAQEAKKARSPAALPCIYDCDLG